MSVSISGYWVGITDEQRGGMPGFWNDDRAFGNWMASCIQTPSVVAAVVAIGCAPLLTFTTLGVADDDVDWTTPAELKAASLRLRELVLACDSRAQDLVAAYEKGANHIDPVPDEFARDLADVAQIAEHASSHGVEAMTLEVNW